MDKHGYKHDQGLVDAYQKVYQNGEQQIDEILEKEQEVGWFPHWYVKRKTGYEK